ncbi:MAG: SIS domain-containing protein [Bacteroidales bacterium]|nr:SIS domain-containing protein [Bacteroidales bacterium]
MDKKNILNELINRYPALEICRKDIEKACEAIIDCYSNDSKLLLCGNGGSGSDADHIVGELMKSFEKKRPIDKNFENCLKSVSHERGGYIAENLQNALPAISLNAHNALISAISNDVDASLVFAQQVEGYGKKGDILIAISTSGNSQNIVDAAITAKAKGITVIGLTGKHGGEVKQYCDIAICVPARNTAEVQEFHLPVYHTICKVVENKFF